MREFKVHAGYAVETNENSRAPSPAAAGLHAQERLVLDLKWIKPRV